MPADDKVVPSGALDVSVEFMGTPIFQTTWDLCTKAKCPIEPGDLKIQYTQNLPPVAPPVCPHSLRMGYACTIALPLGRQRPLRSVVLWLFAGVFTRGRPLVDQAIWYILPRMLDKCMRKASASCEARSTNACANARRAVRPRVRVVQGDYEVKLQAKDDEGEELFCMLVDFTIKPPSLSSFAKSIREAI